MKEALLLWRMILDELSLKLDLFSNEEKISSIIVINVLNTYTFFCLSYNLQKDQKWQATILYYSLLYAICKIVMFIFIGYYHDDNEVSLLYYKTTSLSSKLQSSFSKTINFPLFLHIKKVYFEKLDCHLQEYKLVQYKTLV
jgi:hypothetical protein